MKVTFLFCAFFAFSLLCAKKISAQAPGYMGKRFSVGYDLFLINNLRNQNYSGNEGPLSFTLNHRFLVDYIVSRRVSLGLGYAMSRNRVSIWQVQDDRYYYEYDKYTYTLFNTKDIAFYTTVSRYRKPGAIISVGPYVRWGLHLIMASLDKIEGVGSIPTIDSHTYKSPALSFEIGTQRMLFKSAFIRYGLRLTYVSGGDIGDAIKSSDKHYAVYSATLEADYKQAAFTRLQQQYGINLFIGIGGLLF